MLIFNTSFGYAASLNEQTLSKQEMYNELEKNVEVFEVYFEENNTNVVEILENDKVRLNNLIKNETDLENIEKLQNLINTYDVLISDYKNYTENDTVGKEFVTYGVSHPVLSPAVAAIVSYFTLSGYHLLAELLTHAKDTTGGIYSPYLKNFVLDTTAFQNLRAQIKATGNYQGSGSSSFPPSSGTKNMDLYYAIHLYDYIYAGYTFTVIDMYDFAPSNRYEGLAGTAVNTMYMAQTLGVITPYQVRMQLNF